MKLEECFQGKTTNSVLDVELDVHECLMEMTIRKLDFQVCCGKCCRLGINIAIIGMQGILEVEVMDEMLKRSRERRWEEK